VKALILALLCACTTPHLEPPPAPTVDDRLRALAVGDDDYYRAVLYTWTTPASVADLRASGQLLVATATSGAFTSPFNRALDQRARHGDPIAQLLVDDPRLIHRRYAWPAPFATVMGLGPRRYGDALICIELRPEAWIARFEPASARPFSVVDAHGDPVSQAQVLASPGRLAAVFHVRTDRAVAVRFREYVVVNPEMVARWSVGTPAIRAALDDEIALIHELAPRFATLSRLEMRAPAARAWRSGRTKTLLGAWHAALAFDNERYRADPRALADILDALDDYDPTP
jgi:hypothetical protein